MRSAIARLAAYGLVVGILTLQAIGISTASAAKPTIEEFGPFSPGALPCEVEFDRKGILWVELVGANAMGRLDPKTGEIQQYPLPTPAGIPGGMELGPDGGIWFPEVVGNQIVRLDPDTAKMQTFTIPFNNLLGPNVPYGGALSDDVTFGKDGALYFTLIGMNAIGRMDIKTKKFTKIETPTKPSGPAIIQPGPGNLLIFGMITANKVGALDTSTQTIREYAVPSFPTQGVALGPDNAIWYTAPLAQKIGRIDPRTGKVTEVDLIGKRKGPKLPLSLGNPLPVPTTMRTGSDGKLYFGQGGLLFPSFGNKIGVYDPISDDLEELETPSPLSTPCDQNSQKPGEVWTGLFVANKVGRIKVDVKPELNVCRQEACPDSVPTSLQAAGSPPAATTNSPKACVTKGSRATVPLGKQKTGTVSRRVTVGGKTVARPTSRARSAKVAIPKATGRTLKVRIVSKLRSGRTVTVTRTLKVC